MDEDVSDGLIENGLIGEIVTRIFRNCYFFQTRVCAIRIESYLQSTLKESLRQNERSIDICVNVEVKEGIVDDLSNAE